MKIQLILLTPSTVANAKLVLDRPCRIFRIKLEGASGEITLLDGPVEKSDLIFDETLSAGQSVDFNATPLTFEDFVNLSSTTIPSGGTLHLYYGLG
jgi:hypothetical protein